MWLQKEIHLKKYKRGFHLINNEILTELPEIHQFQIAMMNIFIKHTSASLTINENADPSVRQDFESYFSRSIAENEPYYQHIDEGADDMPAHLKSSILGCSLDVPIKEGQLNMGIWQGIYLCEHRNHASRRQVVITIHGQTYPV